MLNREIAGGCLNEARILSHGVEQHILTGGREEFKNFTIFGELHVDKRHSEILFHKVDLQNIKFFK